MQMDEGMDTGAVLARAALDIGAEETAGELSPRLVAARRASSCAHSCRATCAASCPRSAQDHARATLAPMLEKEHGRDRLQRHARASCTTSCAACIRGPARTRISTGSASSCTARACWRRRARTASPGSVRARRPPCRSRSHAAAGVLAIDRAAARGQAPHERGRASAPARACRAGARFASAEATA